MSDRQSGIGCSWGSYFIPHCKDVFGSVSHFRGPMSSQGGNRSKVAFSLPGSVFSVGSWACSQAVLPFVTPMFHYNSVTQCRRKHEAMTVFIRNLMLENPTPREESTCEEHILFVRRREGENNCMQQLYWDHASYTWRQQTTENIELQYSEPLTNKRVHFFLLKINADNDPTRSQPFSIHVKLQCCTRRKKMRYSSLSALVLVVLHDVIIKKKLLFHMKEIFIAFCGRV